MNREGIYSAQKRETIAEAHNLRVRLLELAEGQCVPWHYHSQISDHFFCMEGPMQVLTRNPDISHILKPGGTCLVEPGTVHYVSGIDHQPCKFMIVQGVGVYDYIEVEQ